MNLGQSIRSGTKWLMLGKTGHRFFEFAFGVILARLLVPADFGMIATVAVFTGFVGMFASGGMGQSLIRAKAAEENDFTAVFTLQLIIGVFVYLAFFVTAPWIAAFFEDPVYTDLIRVSALSFLLRPFAAVRSSWLNRAMAFKSQSILTVVAGLVTGISGTLMAWSGMGVWSLMYAGLLTALFRNIWLGRITPLRLRINMDVATMRKHSSFGFLIVANDFVTYLRVQGRNLILSKMGGPAFLGLFNKAESLSRLPNQLMVPATMEPLFRGMSRVQDDLDQTKYLFYRTITLLMVYTLPIYVMIWWVAEPFIGVVYGEKWLPAGAVMSILASAGLFLNVIYPSGVLLAAQNRLKQEIFAQSLNLFVVATACVVGLEWGLEGVAWGIVLSHALLATHFYWLVYRTLHTRFRDLVRAVAPGVSLSASLFLVLSILHMLLGEMRVAAPALYLLVMVTVGGLFYMAVFLLVPIPSLKSEADRWRHRLRAALPGSKK